MNLIDTTTNGNKAGTKKARETLHGIIFDIQRYCFHDGPGVRTVVFLKGCPLKCAWCCNPESISARPEIMLFKSSCMGCGACIDACTRGALSFKDGRPAIERTQCDACGACSEACPTESIQIRGRRISLEDLLSEVMKDKVFFINSGGGVTLSGGEPTAQPKFATKLLSELKSNGIHTAIETNGYAKWRIYEEILLYCDLFLMDLKHLDPDMHFQYTGVSNEQILYNLEHLLAENKSLIIRIPVIPEFNDQKSHMKDLASYIQSLEGPVKEVHLLPYHRLGVQKYARLGKDYALDGVEPVSRQKVEELACFFDEQRLHVKIGG